MLKTINTEWRDLNNLSILQKCLCQSNWLVDWFFQLYLEEGKSDQNNGKKDKIKNDY